MLASCILPIADRRSWFPQALECFLSQTWNEKELVVIEDGRESVADLIPSGENIQYHRLTARKRLIGEKRNIACSRARGEIIFHNDSDDWYGPNRIAEQVEMLLAAGPDVVAVGYHNMVFADDANRKAWLYRHSPGYAVGTSLCYWRWAWEDRPFRADAKYGEDNDFIGAYKGRIRSTTGESIVARVHGEGTSPRNMTGWPTYDYESLRNMGYPTR